ncbi:MAG TPA: hypothetical protein PLC42_01190 [Parachlamydiaceae bacterium]|nr:hypothetical protein [Parachlamydiaceae bacterium]
MVEEHLSLKLAKKITGTPLVLGFVLLPLLLLGLFWLIAATGVKTTAKYHQLMASTGAEKETQKEPYQINQERQFVQKDMAFFKKGQKMYFRLVADSSKFILDHQGLNTEMAEHMKNVTCYMQEELYYLLPDGREVLALEDETFSLKENGEKILDVKELKPMQLMHKMEAKEGIYYYKSDFFIAKNVKLERFLIEGHELLKSSADAKKIMDGVAESAEFCLKEKNLDFKANQLKAKFYEL